LNCFDCAAGIEWQSVSKELVMPPSVPSVLTEGDTSNYDFYPEEGAEASEASTLTFEERELFRDFDRILERPVQ
jgi:hypothetical protein